MIPKGILNQLHHVKVDNPEIDLQYFPNFMIIGPPRAGTTWLSDNLRFHPQIMMTVPKEIFFFNRLNRPNDPKCNSDKLDWYITFFQDSASSDMWRRKRHFCVFQYDEPYRPIVRGEASTTYATLDESIIREISILNPPLRIIMLIRKPVDRAWSNARRHFTRNQRSRLEEVTTGEFEDFFNQPFQRRCAQYTQNIDRWLSHFDNRSLFIGCFDDIRKRPVKLLVDVMNFVGVKADKKYIQPYVNEVINATEPFDMPPACGKALESLLRDDIENVEKRFGIHWS